MDPVSRKCGFAHGGSEHRWELGGEEGVLGNELCAEWHLVQEMALFGAESRMLGEACTAAGVYEIRLLKIKRCASSLGRLAPA